MRIADNVLILILQAIQALRRPDERVIGPVGLRQFDVPVGWVPKDAILLTSAPSQSLIACVQVLDRARDILARPITAAAVSELSSIYDGQLLFVHPEQLDGTLARSARVLFQNDVWAIVSARPSR